MQIENLAGKQYNGFSFGLGERAVLADELHAFANAVAAGTVQVVAARKITRVKQDDFAMCSAIIQFAERGLPT